MASFEKTKAGGWRGEVRLYCQHVSSIPDIEDGAGLNMYEANVLGDLR